VTFVRDTIVRYEFPNLYTFVITLKNLRPTSMLSVTFPLRSPPLSALPPKTSKHDSSSYFGLSFRRSRKERIFDSSFDPTDCLISSPDSRFATFSCLCCCVMYFLNIFVLRTSCCAYSNSLSKVSETFYFEFGL